MAKIKKIAVINDLSGASRCSLTTAIPVISALGINPCVMPTALLSNHTGHSEYFFKDLTDEMNKISEMWSKLELEFDAVYSGFLGSEKQIDIVKDFIKNFSKPETKIIIDPVMGDNGEIYSTYTDEMCEKMKDLICDAHIITPNLTEACVLCGMEYVGEHPSDEALLQIAEKLCSMGPESVIITGCKDEGSISNAVYFGGEMKKFSSPLIPKYFTGTGDAFASLVSGLVTLGKSVFEATAFATDFIHKCSAYSLTIGQSVNEGIACEKFLPLLTDFQRR